jgi:pantoate--beta-alanine ligase
MGGLHDGHLSLVAAAGAATDSVAVTIFVNPLQFEVPADLAAYPADLATDLETARRAGVGFVFAPSAAEMYPEGAPSTVVSPGRLGTLLEGRSRPRHFEGVATVVTKLLSLSGRSTCFFGEKDFQQLRIVVQLVADLDLPASIVGCPTVREADGLAVSTRNRRLSPGEREAAGALWRALEVGRRAFSDTGDIEVAEAAMEAELGAEPLVRPDYAVAVDPATLRRPASGAGPIRLLVAASVGGVRLIDNAEASPPRSMASP